MDQLINIIGSYILSGYIILSILYMNFRMNNAVSQFQQDSFSGRNVSTLSKTLEYDMYKAGYRVTSNYILQADSTAIKFLSDLDNNGTVDTVSYYVGSTSSLSSTPNPRDFNVYRKLNASDILIVAYATSLRFTYSDSMGTVLNLASLSSQTNRNKIKYITTYVRGETTDSLTYAYSPVEWQIKISPKNF